MYPSTIDDKGLHGMAVELLGLIHTAASDLDLPRMLATFLFQETLKKIGIKPLQKLIAGTVEPAPPMHEHIPKEA